ncbi:MAG: hypothetical protein RLZZ387_5331 [Chloroflexota bacterium]
MEPSDTSDVRPLDLLDVQVWQSVYWAEVQRRISPFFA